MLIFTTSLHASDVAEKKVVHSQPSVGIQSDQVQLYVTETGGHMAPVTFYRDSDKPISPYHISPWQDEPAKPMPAPVLVTLRGDFFCMPFGGNANPVQGEKHPPHGEVAGSAWKFGDAKKQGKVTTLTMSIDTEVRRGRVTKQLQLVDGQNVVYSQHTIEGFEGRVPLGHHATLAMPDREGAVRIATSRFRFGMTYPGVFSDPKSGEYQSLLPGAEWKTLKEVPVAWQKQAPADLTALPARQGFADLVQIVNEEPKAGNVPAWTAATFVDDGYLWFSMKDPKVLRTTVFWIENRGRHGHPWNGRNNCLGLEDVTASFADGLEASIGENELTKRGVSTAIELRADKPTSIRYIQGVVKVPAGFGEVSQVEFKAGEATFVDAKGLKATAKVHHEYLQSGSLPQ